MRQAVDCMKPNISRIIAVACLIVVFILVVAGYQLITTPARMVDKCADIMKAWGQTKVTITSQNDCLEVKPAAELVFAKIRVRSILTYQTTVFGSTKIIIGHQAFDIRLGWDLRDNFKVTVQKDNKTARIVAPPPKVLTVAGVEPMPVVLYREDGVINKLTPEDGFEFSRQLKSEAMGSADMNEARATAKEGFEKFFKCMFELQGLAVSFDYTDKPSPIINLKNADRTQ